MPLIIRELVIRATVEQPPASGGGAATPAAAQQDVIAEAVSQVLEILRRGEER